jgi:hypothetical protein
MLQRVPRPKWTPKMDEQRRAITAVLRTKKQADEAEGKMWEAVATAIEMGVPAAFMAETVERSRATLYRHVDRSTTAGEQDASADGEPEGVERQPSSE